MLKQSIYILFDVKYSVKIRRKKKLDFTIFLLKNKFEYLYYL